MGSEAIWARNFTKFLIGKDGEVAQALRAGPDMPRSLEKDIEAAL